MKKKLAAALTAGLLALGLGVVPAFAESVTYDFPEYGVRCDVPDTLYVFTQDMAEDDPLFSKFGITYEDEMAYLTSDGSNTLMNTNDALVTFELDLDVYPVDSIDDFTETSEEDLNALLVSYITTNYVDDPDYTVDNYYVETHNGIPYLVALYKYYTDSVTYALMECQTVVNGENYIFTLYTQSDEVTYSMQGYVTTLADNTQFYSPGTAYAALEGTTEESAPAEESAAPEEYVSLETTPAESEAAAPSEIEIPAVTFNPSATTEEEEAESSDSLFSSTLFFNLVGGLAAGLLIGLIPLIVGLKKGKKGLAWGGFAASTVCGVILGLLLALPVAIVFLIIILVTGKKRKGSSGYYDPQGFDLQGGYNPQSGYNPQGYDPQGGYNPQGYDPQGFDSQNTKQPSDQSDYNADLWSSNDKSGQDPWG